MKFFLFSGKLGDKSSQPLLLGGGDDISDEENPVIMEPSSDSVPQYSPSVSHDEKEEEEEQWAGLETAEKEGEEQWVELDNQTPRKGVDRMSSKGSDIPTVTSVHSNQINERGSEVEGDSDDDWGGFDEGEGGGNSLGPDAGGWGSAWTTESDLRTSSVALSQSQGDLRQDTPITTPTTPTGSSKGKLKLSSKSRTTSSSEGHASTATPLSTGGGKREMAAHSTKNNLFSPKSGASELGEKMKGRLKKEDIERLEQQAMLAAAEPDFFADMAPSISGSGRESSNSLSLLSSPKTKGGRKTEMVVTASTGASGSNSLQYQPTPADQVRSMCMHTYKHNKQFQLTINLRKEKIFVTYHYVLT